jgi:hypothetical protein
MSKMITETTSLIEEIDGFKFMKSLSLNRVGQDVIIILYIVENLLLFLAFDNPSYIDSIATLILSFQTVNTILIELYTCRYYRVSLDIDVKNRFHKIIIVNIILWFIFLMTFYALIVFATLSQNENVLNTILYSVTILPNVSYLCLITTSAF